MDGGALLGSRSAVWAVLRSSGRLASVALCLCGGFTVAAEPVHDLAYRERGSAQGERRLEGTKAVPSASLDLQLVSFGARAPDAKPLPRQGDLNVGFFVWSEDPIFIVASEVVPLRNYFMRPVRTRWPMGWQVFGSWPQADVLQPLGIDPNVLGVVARLREDRDGARFVSPVLVFARDPPRQIGAYRLILRSRETLAEIGYVVVRDRDGATVKRVDQRHEYAAESPIVIDLDFAGQPAGSYRIGVKARIKNLNEGPKRTYQFHHQPIVAF